MEDLDAPSDPSTHPWPSSPHHHPGSPPCGLPLRAFSFPGAVALLLVGSIPGEAQQDDDDFLHVGGALRFSLLSQFYEGDGTPNSTQFTWDTCRINVEGRSRGVGIRFEYRFYPTFDTHFIKEGWVEYAASEEMRPGT